MLKLYNALSRSKEEFKPIHENEVGLYTCGPTVYNFAHLGNLRTYVFEDFLKRTLIWNNYQVQHVMNITDVGHLTGDMDMGEDKMEKGAAREGRSAWEVAEFYTQAFLEDVKLLNIILPGIIAKVTDNISEQIDLIKKLEEKNYTYKTSDGIYFDTSLFKEYNKLSHLKLEDLWEGARVEKNPEKRQPTDFALWKFSPAGAKRQMEWESPWGVGFPGWHIECSAISFKYLVNNLDIHCGGIDHINVHHTNEIAQSEAATGKKFFNYWMHGAFLNIVGGKKMAKSDNNFLTLKNAVLEKNLDPLAYRYVCAQTHYRKTMEYSEEALVSANQGLKNLREKVLGLGEVVGVVNVDFLNKFTEAINDDLNMPQATALLFEVLKSDLTNSDKLATVLKFDEVLGFKVNKSEVVLEIPKNIQELLLERQQARLNKDWSRADALRMQIEDLGYLVKDNKDDISIIKL